MTAKAVNNEPLKDGNSGSELHKSRGVASLEMSINAGELTGHGDGKKMSDGRVAKACEEMETDQESGGSSEEFESPKSVVEKVRRWSGKKIVGCVHLHNQVLKIREEDSHLGEDIGECLNAKDKLCSAHHHVVSQKDDDDAMVLLLPKPILPSSPLSGKTTSRFEE